MNNKQDSIARTLQYDNDRSDLSGANLYDANLQHHSFRKADLSGANLASSRLYCSYFDGANLTGVDFTRGDLVGIDSKDGVLCNVNFRRTHFRGANFTGADLRGVNFKHAVMENVSFIGANFEGAIFKDSIFLNSDFTDAVGLGKCLHDGPSSIDHRTLQNSGMPPIHFLRGFGLPERMIEYLPSLIGDAIQFYTCFISYSSNDQEFADRLHSDLQNEGVRYWFAPHDLTIGAKTWDGIDEAIRTRDKVLLILSESAIASDWVEDEVTTAFSEERKRNSIVFFPLRLDDTVMKASEPWAGKLRDNRNICDFSRWKEHDAYKVVFERALRDLHFKHSVLEAEM